MGKRLTGMFDDLAWVQTTVDQLMYGGAMSSDISLLSYIEHGSDAYIRSVHSGSCGKLAGFGAMVMSGIAGRFICAGPILPFFVKIPENGHVREALYDLGLSLLDAGIYQQQILGGRILLSLTPTVLAGGAEQASDIFTSNGCCDMVFS